jgi:hypothetical protein
MAGTTSNDPRPTGGTPRLVKLLLLGGLIAVGVIVGLMLENLFRTRAVSVAGVVPTKTSVAPTPDRLYPTPPPQVGKAPVATAERPMVPPWEATPQNTPPVPPGHIPAWQVKPPRPDPTPPPPPPVPPPDPATHRPPMHNPGGVDGDRPPRPVPGLQ